MSTNSPSLGDGRQNFNLIKETFPLPESRSGILSLLEGVLKQGGVQRIQIQIGKPVQIERLVKDLESPPEDKTADDLLSAIRNGEMEELQVTSSNPYERLFKAFQLLSNRRCLPKTLAVHTHQQIRDWLDLEQTVDVSEIFSIPTITLPDLPEDACLLVAAKADSPDVIAYTVRVPIDIPQKRKKK